MYSLAAMSLYFLSLVVQSEGTFSLSPSSHICDVGTRAIPVQVPASYVTRRQFTLPLCETLRVSIEK